MNWIDKLERKIGRYAIPNITRYLVGFTLAGYILQMLLPNVLNYLEFSPADILHGQIWRLVTWIVMPAPAAGASVLGLIFLICLMFMGNSLEMCLGTFRMNVYIFGGLILNVVGGMLVYVITLFTPLGGVPLYLSPYYILLSIFMALAICMPDAQVRLYFVIPIKMKWMLLVYLLELGYEIYSYFRAGYSVAQAMQLKGGAAAGTACMIGMIYAGEIIFALLNLTLFFYFIKKYIPRAQRKRQKEFRRQFSAAAPRPGSGITQHKCTICGRTEADDPTLVFRYCSKCEGNYEYCQEHLYTHQHVRSS